MSDQLHRRATTWAERYHLSPDRANILRALDLRRTDTVLEIGAGCGAITRFLGETCALVDAIEPEQLRADVARERVRDLSTAQVFAATLDEVPDIPFYDIAVVVGVLEYVGAGSSDENLYIDFLRKVAGKLSPGGTLVCAIENQLGVKYLCGSPEDHTGRPFDGLTGYRNGGPARTFGRTQLAAFFDAAGLKPVFLHAFPDYKMARVVLSDQAFERPHRWLAREIPHFPSADRGPGWPRVADEEDAWRSLVDSGDGSRFANSFLVLGARDATNARWSQRRLAAFNSERRAPVFRTQTLVDVEERVTFTRRTSSSLPVSVGTLAQLATKPDLVEGERLDHHLERLSWHEMEAILTRWRDLVVAHPGLLDLIPANVRVSPGGKLVPFDQEWSDDTYGPEDTLGRGVLSLFNRLRNHTEVARDMAGASHREVAAALGSIVGLDPDGAWIDHAIDREATLQAVVATGVTDGEDFVRVRDSVLAEYQTGFPHPPPPPPPPPPRPPVPVRALRRVSRAIRVLLGSS